MTAGELLAAIEARGVRVAPRGESLAVAPVGILKDADREALRAHKAAILDLLRSRQGRTVAGTDWTRVELRNLDRVLEVAVPWADVPLVLAPGCRVARELRARDPLPGRVWCVCEVLDLLLSNVPPEDARKVAETRLMFAGTLSGVRPFKGDSPPWRS